MQLDEITTINAYAVWKNVNDLKAEIYTKTVTVGGLNIPLTSRDRCMGHKLSKETMNLTQTLEQINLNEYSETVILQKECIFPHQYTELSLELTMF